VLWGLIYALSQKALVNFSPVGVQVLSALLAAIFVVPLAFYDLKGVGEVLNASWVEYGLIVAIVALAVLANFLSFFSIKAIGATKMSILEMTYPFFVALFCFWFFRTSLSPMTWVGAVFIFLGTGIVLYFGK